MGIESGKSDTKGIVKAHYDDDGDQYVNVIDKDGNELEIVNGAVKEVSDTVDFTFQNAAAAAATGNEFTVESYKTLTIEIVGTSTSRTILFGGTGASGTFTQIQGVRLSDNAMANQTTGGSDTTPEIWQFDVTGLKKFRTNLTTVAGGNVTIKGTAVS